MICGMARVPPAVWLAFIALAMCPVACFGDWACSDGDSDAPCQAPGHQECPAHSCLCAGATRSPDGGSTSITVDQPIAVSPISESADWHLLHALTFLERSLPIPETPAARGVLPLLI
jgi:hypothetical protein